MAIQLGLRSPMLSRTGSEKNAWQQNESKEIGLRAHLQDRLAKQRWHQQRVPVIVAPMTHRPDRPAAERHDCVASAQSAAKMGTVITNDAAGRGRVIATKSSANITRKLVLWF